MRIALQVKDPLPWHIVWCTNLSHCHKRWRFRMQKAAVDLGKVKSKKEFVLEAQREKKVHFATLMDTCHLKKCVTGTKAAEVQKQCRAQGRLCKRRFWSSRSFHWTKFICIPDDCNKKHGRYCEITMLWWTSSWCSICESKLEDAPKCSKFQNSNVQMFRYAYYDTTGQNHWQKWRSRDTSWTKLVRSSIGRFAMGKTIRISFIRTWMGENSFVHRRQELFLSKNVDDIKMAGKQQNMAPMWKKLMTNVDIDEPTSFLDPVYLGCTQRESKPNETIIEQF